FFVICRPCFLQARERKEREVKSHLLFIYFLIIFQEKSVMLSLTRYLTIRKDLKILFLDLSYGNSRR
ncbi:MAG: hypothetical protein ABIH37_03440, partial [archaeon]